MQTLSLCHDYLPAIKTRWMILFDWAFYKPHVYQLTSDPLPRDKGDLWYY